MVSPSVSIIIPAYNAAQFLPLTIDSVLNQTYQDFELMVIDDGSSDNTREIVGSFHDTRIHYYYQPNSGLPASARNTGIKHATGDFIAFLDADDMWYPQKLEKVLAAFQCRPTVGIICHAVYIRRDDTIIGMRGNGVYEKDMFKRLLLRGNELITSATSIRKEVIHEVGVFIERPELRCVEDYDLWLRIAQNNFEFYFIPEVLGEYRLHTTNSSGLSGGGGAALFYHNLRNVLREHFQHISSPTWLELAHYRRRLADTYYKCGESLIDGGNFSEGHAQFVKAMLRYPLGSERYIAGIAKLCLRRRHDLHRNQWALTLYASICSVTVFILTGIKGVFRQLYRMYSVLRLHKEPL